MDFKKVLKKLKSGGKLAKAMYGKDGKKALSTMQAYYKEMYPESELSLKNAKEVATNVSQSYKAGDEKVVSAANTAMKAAKKKFGKKKTGMAKDLVGKAMTKYG